MSQLQEKQRVRTEQLPPLFRNRTIEYTLMALGALVAAFGFYAYFAPTGWVLADLSNAWPYSSWIVGGLLLTAGFGMFGAGVRDRSGYWTTGAIVSFLLGTLTLAGAVTAAVLLIL